MNPNKFLQGCLLVLSNITYPEGLSVGHFIFSVRFEILTLAALKISIFRFIMPSSEVSEEYFASIFRV
jgi:hypothetical protein